MPVAQILEDQVGSVPHLIVYRARDTQPPRLREALQSGSHVYAVTVDVVAVDDDIAEVDTDPESNALVLGQAVIVLGNSLLDLGCRGHGIDNAGELRQHAISHQLDDTAAMLGYLWIDEVPTQGFQAPEGAFLVGSDQARIPHDVRREDRRQPSLGAPFSHPLRPGPTPQAMLAG